MILFSLAIVQNTLGNTFLCHTFDKITLDLLNRDQGQKTAASSNNVMQCVNIFVIYYLILP